MVSSSRVLLRPAPGPRGLADRFRALHRSVVRYEAAPDVTGDWDEATRSQSPLADAAWIRAFVAGFGQRATIHALYDGDRLVSAMPLVRDGGLARAWVGCSSHFASRGLA